MLTGLWQASVHRRKFSLTTLQPRAIHRSIAVIGVSKGNMLCSQNKKKPLLLAEEAFMSHCKEILLIDQFFGQLHIIVQCDHCKINAFRKLELLFKMCCVSFWHITSHKFARNIINLNCSNTCGRLDL